jgi:AraC-like DNA-binding protein
VLAQERKFSGQKSAEFAHDRHQLILVTAGAVRVQNNFGIWCVPAGCAAWIPAGVRHAVEGQAAARARTLYIWRSPARALRTCSVLGVSPLLHSLIDHVFRLGTLRADGAASKRLAGVLLDQIGAQDELPLFVPPLRSPLAQRAAAAWQADPADTPRLVDLAGELRVSVRTLERAFVDDVAMTIGDYRRRTRLIHAIGLLAAGAAVKDVALEVGYETASAFVTAYKKCVGATPGNTKNTKNTKSF